MPSPQQNLHQLIENASHLSLATLNDQQQPESSLAPFVYAAPYFYVFTSGLSSHTQNLQRHPQDASLMIHSELNLENAFAITRVSYQVKACEIHDTEQRQAILASFAEKFGEIIQLLASLPDFVLFALQPQNGSFVQGFGQAFDIDSQGKLQAKRPDKEKRP